MQTSTGKVDCLFFDYHKGFGTVELCGRQYKIFDFVSFSTYDGSKVSGTIGYIDYLPRRNPCDTALEVVTTNGIVRVLVKEIKAMLSS